MITQYRHYLLQLLNIITFNWHDICLVFGGVQVWSLGILMLEPGVYYVAYRFLITFCRRFVSRYSSSVDNVVWFYSYSVTV